MDFFVVEKLGYRKISLYSVAERLISALSEKE